MQCGALSPPVIGSRSKQKIFTRVCYALVVERRRRIKMQSAYLQFKHPNILRTSDELSPPNFFLGSIIPKTPEMKKLTFYHGTT